MWAYNDFQRVSSFHKIQEQYTVNNVDCIWYKLLMIRANVVLTTTSFPRFLTKMIKIIFSSWVTDYSFPRNKWKKKLLYQVKELTVLSSVFFPTQYFFGQLSGKCQKCTILTTTYSSYSFVKFFLQIIGINSSFHSGKAERYTNPYQSSSIPLLLWTNEPSTKFANTILDKAPEWWIYIFVKIIYFEVGIPPKLFFSKTLC